MIDDAAYVPASCLPQPASDGSSDVKLSASPGAQSSDKLPANAPSALRPPQRNKHHISCYAIGINRRQHKSNSTGSFLDLRNTFRHD